MSFIGKAVKGIGQAVGIMPKDSKMAPPPVAPMTNSPDASNAATTAAMDSAMQQQAASVQRGRTSTLLTGGDGETEDQKYTSKILLGQ